MGKINTSIIGGAPFDLPDLEFLQDSIEGYLNALAVIIGKKNAVLTGCEVNAGKVEAGYILLNGELLRHQGTVMAISEGANVWWKKETFEMNPVETELGDEVNSWIVKLAVPYKIQVGGGVLLPRVIPAHTNELYTHPNTHPISMITETSDKKVMTKTERDKLASIASGANKYVHPNSHSISMLTETTDKKVMTKAERDKLAGIDNNAKNYTHPNTHPISMITETADKKVMTEAERQKLAGIDDNANNYVHPSKHSANDIREELNLRFVTATEKQKLSNMYGSKEYNGAVIPNLLLLFSGAHTTAYGDNKAYRRAGVFDCHVTREGKGYYKVTHDYDSANYDIHITLRSTKNNGADTLKINGIYKHKDYFTVTIADDMTTNDAQFEFSLTTWGY